MGAGASSLASVYGLNGHVDSGWWWWWVVMVGGDGGGDDGDGGQ